MSSILIVIKILVNIFLLQKLVIISETSPTTSSIRSTTSSEANLLNSLTTTSSGEEFKLTQWKPQFPMEKPLKKELKPQTGIKEIQTLQQLPRPPPQFVLSIDIPPPPSSSPLNSSTHPPYWIPIVQQVDLTTTTLATDLNSSQPPSLSPGLKQQEGSSLRKRAGKSREPSEQEYFYETAVSTDTGDSNSYSPWESIDPCPVLQILCFEDAEYCPAYQGYCQEIGPGGQPESSSIVERTIQCILNWISGPRNSQNSGTSQSSSCPTLFG